MSKFKVGQLVRRLNSSFGNVNEGGVYEVEEYFELCSGLRLKGDTYKYEADNFEPVYTNEPHVHRDLIVAWANGAEIQVYDMGVWTDVGRPCWHPSKKYRVKPEDPNKGEIERIEKEMRKLSDDLAKLRGANIS